MSRFSPGLLAGIIVALFFGIALYIRAALPYDQVFSGDWIKYTGVDAYYHMHLVDNLVHNFPRLMGFDPYFIYPGGHGVGSLRFFDWLLAGIIWVIGLGSPTQHTVDVVGVYFPAVLGALTVIPVYFIGKELFNRWAGVISAGLIAILAGEFLGRSILGFTDHHVAETLFTAVAILFLILAVKTARERQLTFSHLNRRDWTASVKPIVYSVLAGIFLGIYFLIWQGALLFAFIIFVFFFIHFIIDHLKGKSTDYLCLVGGVLFLVTLLMFLSISPGRLYLVSLVSVIFHLLVWSGISWLMAHREIKPAYYPLTLVGLELVGIAIFYIINPSLLSTVLAQFGIFAPQGAQLTTIEMQPLLFPQGTFTTEIAWGNFTTSFYLSFISFGILIYLMVKQGGAEKSLLVVWSLVILAAALGQRRFAYYFTVNVALLTGYLAVLIYYVIRGIFDYLSGNSTDYMSGRFLELAGFKTLAARPVEIPRKWGYYEVLGIPRSATDKQIKGAFRELKYRHDRNEITEERFKEINKAYEVLSNRHKRAAYDRSEYGTAKREREKARRKGGGFNLTTKHISMALAVIAIFFLVFFPNIGRAIASASQARFAPSDAWMSSLSWLSKNTPEPFGDPDFYYELHEPPPPGEKYIDPESAYGVLAWWDYGYWITRIAHRIPVVNPSQQAELQNKVANFFTSQDEDSADEIVKETGSSYIIIDFDTATGKFWAIALWSGKERTEFFDVYLKPQEANRFMSVQLFHPEYYRALSTRLYIFDGEAVTPDSSTVISYELMSDKQGALYKIITSEEQFDSYEEAEAYVSSQKSDNYRIIGDNPFVSPVPLEAVKHYRLVHGSSDSIGKPGGGKIPAVKIFEYID